MIKLPTGPFTTIVADPPWPYGDMGIEGHSALAVREELVGLTQVNNSRYSPMSIDDLCNLPVKDSACSSAHLYLWFTNAFAEEAHKVARAWGFKPKTIITWGKLKHSTTPTPSMKTGYYFRGATEHILFCVRGSLRTRGVYPTLLLTNRLAHSVKPEESYAMIEGASPGPYLEMFARRSRDGWESWGDQVDKIPVLLSVQAGSNLQPLLFTHV